MHRLRLPVQRTECGWSETDGPRIWVGGSSAARAEKEKQWFPIASAGPPYRRMKITGDGIVMAFGGAVTFGVEFGFRDAPTTLDLGRTFRSVDRPGFATATHHNIEGTA